MNILYRIHFSLKDGFIFKVPTQMCSKGIHLVIHCFHVQPTVIRRMYIFPFIEKIHYNLYVNVVRLADL